MGNWTNIVPRNRNRPGHALDFFVPINVAPTFQVYLNLFAATLFIKFFVSLARVHIGKCLTKIDNAITSEDFSKDILWVTN